MLTDTEIKKLQNPDPVRDKSNDFIVRTKFKKWLDSLFVINVLILRYLPERQLKKIIRYDYISDTGKMLLTFLSMAGAVALTKKNEYEYLVALPDQPARYATADEIRLNGLIKYLVRNLFNYLSSEDIVEIIQTEIKEHRLDYVPVKEA